MTTPSLPRVDATTASPETLAAYLARSGWTLLDADEHTAMYQRLIDEQDLRAVVPTRTDIIDYADEVQEALRTVAFSERRSVEEVANDVTMPGGADTIAVRLRPALPSGQAPLGLALEAISALRNYVVGAAAGLDMEGSLVLPSRRPARAETYADQVRLSTAPGSFVVQLGLPLTDEEGVQGGSTSPPDKLLEIPETPYGRRVTNRLVAVTRRSVALAQRVSDGDADLKDFGLPERAAANATELSALAAVGGEDHARYDLRFAQSPQGGIAASPSVLRVTPGVQRVLGEAADFLRLAQPRANLRVQGLVVRLTRDGAFGPGQISVLGATDDSGRSRRVRMNLEESAYNAALRAHREGLFVVAVGDLERTGNVQWLRRVSEFAIVPGLSDD